ncbi:hypothetical protein [Bradyrhizobium sp. sGM-13]|uniref:hypothetical protein n=1 Tax=Bradyrhizobium sp. sGM-13 TaxID=2831781 RepID=UPI001BCCDD81|nr:hypothetical protein [Bradyrhizobium sp. sGM-13]
MVSERLVAAAPYMLFALFVLAVVLAIGSAWLIRRGGWQRIAGLAIAAVLAFYYAYFLWNVW